MGTTYTYGNKFRVMLPETGHDNHVHCVEMREEWAPDLIGVNPSVYYDIRVQDGIGYSGDDSSHQSSAKVCCCGRTAEDLGEIQFESWKIYKRFNRIWKASAMKESMPFVKFYLLSINSDVVGSDYTNERPEGYNNDWASSDEENLGVNE